MVLDNTLKGILETIRLEVKEKFHKDYSIEHLYEVVNYQMEATKIGMVKRVPILWDGFIKFLYLDKVARKRRTTAKVLTALHDSPHLEVEERKALALEATKEDVRGKEKLMQDSRNSKPVSGKELLNKEDLLVANHPAVKAMDSNLILFKNIRR